MKKILIAILAAAACINGYCIGQIAHADRKRIAQIMQWLDKDPGDKASRISNRAIWDELAKLPDAAAQIRQAEHLLGEPVPEMTDEMYLKWYATDYIKDPSAVPYYVPFWKRCRAISTLTTAECLENKGRFLPKLQEYLLAITSMRTWVQPSHDPNHLCFDGKRPTIDLGSAGMAIPLALCCDWLQEVLPSDIRERVINALEKQIFTPYRLFIADSTSRPGWFFCDSNWNAVCHGGSVRAALAVLPSRYDRAAFLEAGERCIRHYTHGFYSDGVCKEGMDYWNYGYFNFINFALSVRRMTGGNVDFLADEQSKRNFAFAFGGMLEPWISPHFADGGANPNPRNVALGAQVWPEFASAKSDAVSIFAGELAMQSVRMFEPGAIDRAKSPKRDDDLTLPKRTWYPAAQILTSRPIDCRTGGLAATMKGGSNAEHHNHNDLGSYAILFGGIEMAGDPGGAVYTKTTFTARRYENPMINSFGHPVPVVAGKLQEAGKKFAGKVIRTEFTDERDCYALDLTNAYDVPELKQLVRAMIYRRGQPSVTFRDIAKFSKPSTFETAVITYADAKRADDDSSWILSAGDPKRELAVKIDVRAGGAWKIRRETVPNPKKREPTRLAVVFSEPVLDADVRITFSPVK